MFFHCWLTTMTQWLLNGKIYWKSSSHFSFQFLPIQVKLAKTVLLLIGVYIVTWIPICVIHFLRVARIGNIPDSVDLAAAFLMSISCVTNPWIYGYRHSQFRDQVRRMLCLKKRATDLERQANNRKDNEMTWIFCSSQWYMYVALLTNIASLPIHARCYEPKDLSLVMHLSLEAPNPPPRGDVGHWTAEGKIKEEKAPS